MNSSRSSQICIRYIRHSLVALRTSAPPHRRVCYNIYASRSHATICTRRQRNAEHSQLIKRARALNVRICVTNTLHTQRDAHVPEGVKFMHNLHRIGASMCTVSVPGVQHNRYGRCRGYTSGRIIVVGDVWAHDTSSSRPCHTTTPPSGHLLLDHNAQNTAHSSFATLLLPTARIRGTPPRRVSHNFAHVHVIKHYRRSCGAARRVRRGRAHRINFQHRRHCVGSRLSVVFCIFTKYAVIRPVY